MRTPAGKECRYFYGDYYRGRQHEECRLLNSQSPPLRWQRDLCTTCPVPGILLANACNNMEMIPSISRPFPFIKLKVQIRTYCLHTRRADFDPHIGCGECHNIPDIFRSVDDKNSSV